MAAYTFNNAHGTNLWSDLANWTGSPSVAPLSLGGPDAITIGAVPCTLDVSITLNASGSCQGTAGMAFTQNAGTTIAISSGTWFSTALAGTTSWTYNGTLNYFSGANCLLGNCTVAGVGSLTLGSTAAINWSSNAAPSMYQATNGLSSINFVAGSAVTTSHTSGTVTLINGLGSGSTATLAGTITQSGTGGTLQIFNIAASATLAISGTATASAGTLTITGGAPATTSALTISGTVATVSSPAAAAAITFPTTVTGPITITGTVAAYGALGTLNAVNTNATMAITNNGAIIVGTAAKFNWQWAGSYSGSGTVTLNASNIQMVYQDVLSQLTTLVNHGYTY